jgi:3-dehydroquinate synthase
VIPLSKYTVTFDNSDITKYIHRDDFIIIDKKLVDYVKGYPNVYQIDAIEENKTITTVMDIISKLNSKRVVVIGGGLVQDVGSFASSIFKRGIEWIYFPTTLLAMADSCIGSKTSLNTNVKNKIGTYHSPKAIYINTVFLNTLSTSHIQSGLGEILKLCMIGNRLNEYEQYRGDFEKLIKLALIIKRSVIEIDEYDTGIRKGLNYGHTLGHVLEVLSNYSIPHGVAVVHGMLLVNKLFGYKNKQFEDLCHTITREKPIVDKTRLKAVLLEDKKADGTSIQFIVPERPGETKFVNVDITICVPKILDLL